MGHFCLVEHRFDIDDLPTPAKRLCFAGSQIFGRHVFTRDDWLMQTVHRVITVCGCCQMLAGY